MNSIKQAETDCIAIDFPVLLPNPPRSEPLPNHLLYTIRLLRVRDALDALYRMGIDVLDIDLNRPNPVITIPMTGRNRQLGKCATYQFCRDYRGRVRRWRVMVEACRVEWDEVRN